MHHALHRAKFNCSQYPYVITLDIKSYFDAIPHDKLPNALQFYCKEKWVSLNVSRGLKASVGHEDVSQTEPQSGTPQGGTISPLISNLYLHVVFDGWMKQPLPSLLWL
jgi:RNA-directed DNA polymerase